MKTYKLGEIILTVLLATLGFSVARLYTSVDNLVEATQQLRLDIIKRPEIKNIANEAAKFANLEHEIKEHRNQ